MRCEPARAKPSEPARVVAIAQSTGAFDASSPRCFPHVPSSNAGNEPRQQHEANFHTCPMTQRAPGHAASEPSEIRFSLIRRSFRTPSRHGISGVGHRIPSHPSASRLDLSGTPDAMSMEAPDSQLGTWWGGSQTGERDV